MLTTGEIDRIAAATNQLRPDWPTKSLVTLISEKLAYRTRRDVAVALTWVACDSTTQTPARVLEAGPWWKACNGDGTDTFRPPRLDESCRVCGRYLTACTCDQPTTRPTERTAPTPEYLAMRARLRARKGTADE